MRKPLVLTRAQVFDTETGRLIGPCDILILAGQICRVADPIPMDDAGAEGVDCEGKYVLPGLFDCHTHLCALTNQPMDVQRAIHDECRAGNPFAEDQLAELVLQDFVRRGVTQVRDLGGPVALLKSMKTSAASRVGSGPDIFYAGPMLEKSPLTGQSMNERWPGWTTAVDSPQDAAVTIESLAAEGASHIKVFGKFDLDVLRHLMSCAQRCALPVTCDPGTTFFHDVSLGVGMELGITCFEHAKSLWCTALKEDLREEHDALRGVGPENKRAFGQTLMEAGLRTVSMAKLNALAERMVERDVMVCPTLNVFKYYSERPEAFSESDPEKYRLVFARLFEVSCLVVSVLARHGVKLLVGQDGYVSRFTAREMILLRESGVAIPEILRGATLYPAQWLGIADRYGSVAIGRKANLVVLNRNPLEDIRHIQDIHFVIQEGERIQANR